MNQQNNTFGHCVGQCSSAACIESKTQGHRARNWWNAFERAYKLVGKKGIKTVSAKQLGGNWT